MAGLNGPEPIGTEAAPPDPRAMWPEIAPPDERLPRRVRVVEVGPRDGLQNVATTVPSAVKVRFVDLLSAAGLPEIEVTSFVSPRAVPQLADAFEVFTAVAEHLGTRYSALTPNLKGLERAMEAGCRRVAVFTAASESFTQHNINASIAQSLAAFAPLVERARSAGIGVRGYVSTAFGCPYEGHVSPARVVEVTGALIDLGVDEVSIGDTIGVATPGTVRRVLDALLAAYQREHIAVHFHDTRGTALANVLAALEHGITTIDSSAGGLGGCPYAPGASGNLATEDLLYMLHGLGIATGVDLAAVTAASVYLSAATGLQPSSRYVQAITAAGRA